MPENTNIIVTSLPEYVEQNRDQLVRKVVLGGRTIRYMVPQVGIKTKAAINYLDVDPKFQDGRGCKFTPQEGGIELTQREIETGLIKVEYEICPDTLLGKYAEYLVKISATEQDFPFEEFIIADTLEKIDWKIERAIWRGDKENADVDLNRFNGLLKLASESEETVLVNFAQNATAWDKIKAVIMALPEEVLETSGRAVVFVGTDMFRSFMLEVVEKNFYHYSGPQNENPKEFVFPGTDIVVVSTVGLSKTGIIYGTHDRNLYYGCDLLDAKEEVLIKWDEMDRVFKLTVRWNSGVQTAFPDLVVVGSPTSSPDPDPDPETVTIYGPNALSLTGDGDIDTEGAIETVSGFGMLYTASNGSPVSAAVKDAGTLQNPTVEVVNNNIVIVKADSYQYVEGGGVARVGTITVSAGTGSKDVTVSQAMLPQGA